MKISATFGQFYVDFEPFFFFDFGQFGADFCSKKSLIRPLDDDTWGDDWGTPAVKVKSAAEKKAERDAKMKARKVFFVKKFQFLKIPRPKWKRNERLKRPVLPS